MTYARHESPSSSVVRASDRCTEGHGFDSRWGLRFFSLSHARHMLNIPSFLKSNSLLCVKNVLLDPAFPGLFVWIEKDRDPVKCNACAVNQKIVTAWFSGNALFSTELLVRIS